MFHLQQLANYSIIQHLTSGFPLFFIKMDKEVLHCEYDIQRKINTHTHTHTHTQ